MPAVATSFLAAATVLAVPLAWLLSRWLDDDAAGWSAKALLAGLLCAAALLLLLRLAWRGMRELRARRRARRDLQERKARLWNKLSSLGSPLANWKILCLEDYEALRGRIRQGTLAPIDVLEAFQVRTLMLDQQTSRVKEVVYDADVRAFLLEGSRAAETLIPAATFYYNPALAPYKVQDEDGEMSDKDHAVVKALRAEGAIDIGLVADRDIAKVSSLLLNHGAHFFAGQYPTSNLGAVLRAIASKPVCGTLLSRDQPPGKFLALLACQSRLPAMAAAAVTPGMHDHSIATLESSAESSDGPASPYRVGFVFVHQRRSQADGRRPHGEAGVAELLATTPKVELARGLPFAERVLAASAAGDVVKVRAEVEAALAEHALDGLAVVSGVDCRLAEQLAGFMDLSVFHLVDHLAELYLCHRHDRLRAGLAVAQSFASVIRL